MQIESGNRTPAGPTRRPPRQPIEFTPRGLSADEAARYVGLGRTTFEALVAGRKMPKPKRVGGRNVYDRWALDAYFADLDDSASNRLDDLLSGAAA